MVEKIDSNQTGLLLALEATLGKLSEGTTWPEVRWNQMEPNSFGDFGATYKRVARQPITPDRQNRKGTITDMDSNGGFNQDLTASLFSLLGAGFFFSVPHRKPMSSNPYVVGSAIELVSVTAAGIYTFASALSDLVVGHIVQISGCANAINNGVFQVTAVTGATVTLNNTNAVAENILLTNHQTSLITVGMRATGDTVYASDHTLSFPAGISVTNLHLNVGEFIYVETEDLSFFARVKAIGTNITIDSLEGNFAPFSVTGEVTIYIGTFIRNETSCANMKRYSYHALRTFGCDNIGKQYELLKGCIPNSLKINMPTASLITADVSFVSTDYDIPTAMLAGTIMDQPTDEGFNTTHNLNRVRLLAYDPATGLASTMFARVESSEITMDNGVTPNKALGKLGAFEASTANFTASGTAKVYFGTTDALKAIRNNWDCSYQVITKSNSSGIAIDLPLVSLGGGAVAVEKDNPLKQDLTLECSKCADGYTASVTIFHYLPA